jgi:hypothetical protein
MVVNDDEIVPDVVGDSVGVMVGEIVGDDVTVRDGVDVPEDVGVMDTEGVDVEITDKVSVMVWMNVRVRETVDVME